MIFIPIPLPENIAQTSSCTILLYKFVIQTVLGMGMGMNVTAQDWRRGCRTSVRQHFGAEASRSERSSGRGMLGPVSPHLPRP